MSTENLFISYLSCWNFIQFLTGLDLWISDIVRGQKISNFTFDAHSQQWLVQLPQNNHQQSTVRHNRWDPALLYSAC